MQAQDDVADASLPSSEAPAEALEALAADAQDAPVAESSASEEALGSARDALAEQASVGFVYFDNANPVEGDEQLVAVALGDESFAIESAQMRMVAPSGESQAVASSACAGNAALFPVGDLIAGEYRLETMTATEASTGRSVEVDLGAYSSTGCTFAVSSDDAPALLSNNGASDELSTTVLVQGDDGKLEAASSVEEAVDLSADSALSAGSGLSARSSEGLRAGTFVIALDPGHGGKDPGASKYGLNESNVNWKIAQYCKEALSAYANVEVMLTRGENECPSLTERVNRAVAAHANVVVSLHINSGAASAHGAEVWIPNDSSYKYQVHESGSYLGTKILEQLAALGLSNRGVKERDSEYVAGEGPFYYPDGSIQDYYTVIEQSREAGIPGVIVEHAFISNASENAQLKNDAFLKQLGYADAAGIAEAYGLSTAWEKVDGRWKLRLADGSYATNRWCSVQGQKYWFGADSFAVTGWQTIEGSRYYFNGSCAMQTGWLKQGSDWYYLSNSGVMSTGWLNLGSTWYWLDPATGKMATGWATVDNGKRYYFEGSGAMRAGGWIKWQIFLDSKNRIQRETCLH